MSEKNMYGSNPELDRLVDDDNWMVRVKAVFQDYGLDKLIDDEDYRVRGAVAKRGYGLDRLVNDESDHVRAQVAYKDYRLDKLVNDDSANVREVVAFQGYGLDKLINDEDSVVREFVAKIHGYGLNRLVDDEHFLVRLAVAKRGYGLDKLASDEEYDVRQAVQDSLEASGYVVLDDWIKDNPDKCALPENRKLNLSQEMRDRIKGEHGDYNWSDELIERTNGKDCTAETMIDFHLVRNRAELDKIEEEMGLVLGSFYDEKCRSGYRSLVICEAELPDLSSQYVALIEGDENFNEIFLCKGRNNRDVCDLKFDADDRRCLLRYFKERGCTGALVDKMQRVSDTYYQELSERNYLLRTQRDNLQAQLDTLVEEKGLSSSEEDVSANVDYD